MSFKPFLQRYSKQSETGDMKQMQPIHPRMSLLPHDKWYPYQDQEFATRLAPDRNELPQQGQGLQDVYPYQLLE
jgi:hypothetical protein